MSDAGAGWLTTEQLLDAAHGEGFTELTARRIEAWRNQKLLPRPTRAGQDGRRPVWLSPPETLDQLMALCQLRDGAKRHRRTMNETVLRLRLWLRGPDADLEQVRADLRAVVDDSERIIEAELDKIAIRERLSGDPADIRLQALTHLAGQLAGQRGMPAVPPRSPSTRAHRQKALHALLYTFYTGTPPDPSVATGEQVERGLGLLPRGRLDRLDERVGWRDEPVGPWHDGTPLDLNGVAALLNLSALRQTIDMASDDDLRYVRKATPVLASQLPVVTRGAAAWAGVEEFLGLAGLRRLPLSDHDAGIAVLVLALRSSHLRSNLEAVVESVEGAHRHIDRGLQALFGTQPQDLQARMDRADPPTAQRVRRLMGEFTAAPAPKPGRREQR